MKEVIKILFEDLIGLFNEVGIKMIREINIIHENFDIPEDYIAIEKHNDHLYEIYTLRWTRTDKPYKENIKIFEEESEAVKFFFLSRLYYKFISEEIANAKIKYNYGTFDFLKLDKLMEGLNIPINYYSIGSELKDNSINFLKVSSKWKIRIIGRNKKVIAESMIPIEENRTAFLGFDKIYALYLLDKLVNKLLEQGKLLLPFTDNDKAIFLGFKINE